MASLNSLRGRITNVKKLVQNDISMANSLADPSQAVLERLKKDDATIVELSKVYEQTATLAADEDEAYVETVTKNLADDRITLENLQKEVLAAMIKMEGSTVATGPAPGGAATASVKVKVDSALKPHKLTKEMTPVEFKNWAKLFKAWYEASNMDKATVGTQQSYLRVCLASDLSASMDQKISDSTPIFGTGNSCFAVLEEEFGTLYPTYNRRTYFFIDSRKPGESFASFAKRKQQEASECNIGDLKTDEILAFVIVSQCNNIKMKEKFLENKATKLCDIISLGRAIESAQKSAQIGQEASAAKAHTQNGNKGKNGNKGDKGKYQGSSRQEQNAKSQKCSGCGGKCDPKRKNEVCPARNVKCRYCSKEGHYERECRKKKREQGSSKSSSNNNKSKAYKAQKEEESSDQDEEEAKFARPHEERSFRAEARVSQNNKVAKATPRMLLKISGEKKEGEKVSFLLKTLPDSGATSSLMPLSVARKYKLLINKSFQPNIRIADNTLIRSEGITKLKAEYQGKSCVIRVIVSEKINETLIGWTDLVNLNVLSPNFPNVMSESASSANVLLYRSDIEETVKKLEARPTDEELEDLEKFVEDMKRKYPDVLSDEMSSKPIKAPPVKIELRSDKKIVPKRISVARPYPVHYRKEAAEKIRQLEADGIIEKVTEATEWSSPAFFVVKEPKPGEKQTKTKLRFVTDFSELNKYIARPIWPFQCGLSIVNSIEPGNRFWAKLDCLQGYHQLELDEESSKLTTFLVESGRYRYRRLPMGASMSSDHFCRITDEALNDLPQRKLIDDIVTFDPTADGLKKKIEDILIRCREKGITLSRKKVEVGGEINFAGFILDANGSRPDPERVSALADFPRPKNLAQLRSFIGLVQTFNNFSPDIAHLTAVLRPLMSTKMAFNWLPEHTTAFEKLKAAMTSEMNVSFFDINRPTVLFTDASKVPGALGYGLCQVKEDGNLTLIQCGSRACVPAEKNYAIVELECKAIEWALQKCRHFLYGCPSFEIRTDHRPLLGVFAKDLDEVKNDRLRSYREHCMDYNFELKYCEGVTHYLADCMSRIPAFYPNPPDVDITYMAVESDPLIGKVAACAKQDVDYKEVMEALKVNLRPKNFPVCHPARDYVSCWDELSILKVPEGELLIRDGSRIVLPLAMRGEILQQLHAAHSGITKTRAQANQMYYYPRMSTEIEEMIKKCATCAKELPSKHVETTRPTSSDEPFDHVGCDLFHWSGKTFLITVDHFSNYCFVNKLRDGTSETVQRHLQALFDVYGYPKRLRADFGPCFRDSFTRFCEERGIIRERSSPYFPSSSGLAENGVHQMKLLLKKSQTEKAFEKALSAYRNMAKPDGISPAQAFFLRTPRTLLPALEQSRLSAEQINEKIRLRQDKTKEKANLQRKEKPFYQGQRVWIQDKSDKRWSDTGTILSSRDSEDSYSILNSEGVEIIRNKKFLRPVFE